jgi:hypothetical protein
LEHAEGISGDEVPDDQLAIIARRKKNVGVEWVDGEDVDLESSGRRRRGEEEEEEGGGGTGGGEGKGEVEAGLPPFDADLGRGSSAPSPPPKL